MEKSIGNIEYVERKTGNWGIEFCISDWHGADTGCRQKWMDYTRHTNLRVLLYALEWFRIIIVLVFRQYGICIRCENYLWIVEYEGILIFCRRTGVFWHTEPFTNIYIYIKHIFFLQHARELRHRWPKKLFQTRYYIAPLSIALSSLWRDDHTCWNSSLHWIETWTRDE